MHLEKISVIVPCFNEERTIYQNIKKIFQYLEANFESFEIIAVNDGSTDETVRELKKVQDEISLTIIDNYINEGKGKAVRDGILQSNGEIVMFLDADLAIPIEELSKFVAKINNGYDIVIASRFVPGGKVIRRVLWYRVIMEKIFRIIRTIIINNYKIKDTQCGFKVFERDAAMKIFPMMTVKRFAFDAEIIFLAEKLKYKVKELPITLQNPIKSHIRIFRDSLNMILDLINIRLNDFLKNYKVISFKKNVLLGAILLFFVFFFVTSEIIKASDYDIYVDQGYNGNDPDGSSKKPYKTIKKAIEESSSKEEKIYVKNGTYSETFSLKDGDGLYGQSKDKTIIKGTITSEGNNLIKNIAIIGKSYGIISSGEIESCKIKNSSKIAINLLESGEEASITNSIISGNEKGIYVQRKRSILISGNSVYNNSEEGIDIRDKVSGTINNNEIYENGESGIEIIVGGSDIKISENEIKKNKASGIASQFYSFIGKTGSIDIKNNIISKNGKYGFACGLPSGGKPSGSYWDESIKLEDNTIENNKINAVDDTCNIIEAVGEEEEADNITIEDESNSEAMEEMEEKMENNETKEQLLKEAIAEQISINDALSSSADEIIKSLSGKSKLKSFFIGISSKNISQLGEKQIEINKQAVSLEDMLAETNDAENKASLEEEIKKLKSKSKSINSFKEEQKNKFSLWGWIKNLFGNF
jgi:parallel beta-helix repeat protein